MCKAEVGRTQNKLGLSLYGIGKRDDGRGQERAMMDATRYHCVATSLSCSPLGVVAVARPGKKLETLFLGVSFASRLLYHA